MSENKRSSVIIFNPNAKTEEFKRSNHADFATTTELKQRRYSGQRHNTLTSCYEIWVDGEIRKSVTEEEVRRDEFAITKAMVEVFGIA